MKKDLAHLFRWNKKVEIKDREDNVLDTLYVRLVGDVDYNHAQQHALVASRKLRKKLKDTNSVDHQALFFDIDERNKEDVIFGILMAEIANFRDLAVADLGDEIFEIKVPTNADTLEEREQQQEAEEKLANEKVEKLRMKMEEKSEERKAELDKLSIKELRNIFMESSINSRCVDEFSTVFREYCIFSGTYKDPSFKQKAFDDFDDFRNISPNLKRPLIDAYLQLELSGEQLKN